MGFNYDCHACLDEMCNLCRFERVGASFSQLKQKDQQFASNGSGGHGRTSFKWQDYLFNPFLAGFNFSRPELQASIFPCPQHQLPFNLLFFIFRFAFLIHTGNITKCKPSNFCVRSECGAIPRRINAHKLFERLTSQNITTDTRYNLTRPKVSCARFNSLYAR